MARKTRCSNFLKNDLDDPIRIYIFYQYTETGDYFLILDLFY